MSTTPPTDPVGRVFDLLEVLRDAVTRLSHEHDQIRSDIRELRAAIAAQALL